MPRRQAADRPPAWMFGLPTLAVGVEGLLVAAGRKDMAAEYRFHVQPLLDGFNPRTGNRAALFDLVFGPTEHLRQAVADAVTHHVAAAGRA